MADTGKGIAPAQLATIGKRFSRGDSDKPGAGLGLPIVEEIARLFGGTVEIVSAPAQGFTAIVRFPPPGA
jgi:two-component system sensor histidine kinase TctE